MVQYRRSAAFLLGLAAALACTGGAMAVEAAASVQLNVRSGPGPGFGVLDTLAPGEVVEVTECAPSGWCYVLHDGPDGWASSTYLVAPGPSAPPPAPSPTPPPPASSDCSFGFNFGGGAPGLSINCGGGATPPAPPLPPAPEPEEDGACFYTEPNYAGSEVCYGLTTRNSLNATLNDRISSVRLFGAAQARLCVDTNLNGVCRDFDADAPSFGPSINDRASSLVVYVGAPPEPPPGPGPGPGPGPIFPLPLPFPLPIGPILTPAPVTLSTGPIALQQTWNADLDNGSVGGAGVDIWYQAETAVSKFITPRNGAQLALGDGSNRGFAGCSAAAFSADRIPLYAIPAGTYVCARTDEGHISQFRVNGFTGTTMNLGYTTWQ